VLNDRLQRVLARSNNLRDSLLGPKTDSVTIKANKSRTERRHVQNDHDEREEIHPHSKANPDVHCTNADQPNLSRLAVPDKKWISDFQQTNKDSRDREQVCPSYEYLRIDDVERRADESAPHIRAIPPPATRTFRQPAEKIDDTQVKLKKPEPETEELRIIRSRFSQSPVERISIGQRR